MLTTDQGTTLLLVAKYGPIHPAALARELDQPLADTHRHLTALTGAGLVKVRTNGLSLSPEGLRLVNNDKEADGLPKGVSR